MFSAAFLLVLASATIHALWNLAAKQSSGGWLFFWCFGLFEVLFYTPIVLLFGLKLSWLVIAFAFVSGLIHVAYFLLLFQGYRLGDLSLVYPVSRGLGPVVSVLGAMLIFQEQPSSYDLWGAGIIALGAILLTGDPRQLYEKQAIPALAFGLLVALTIGVYTLWDTYAVKNLEIDSLNYLWINGVVRFLILSPYVWQKRQDLVTVWAADWRKAAIVGFGSLGSYLLFLWAATLAPVSYVSPLRTMSILIGVILGVNFLKERDKWQRISAACIIVFGVILLNW